MYSSYFKPPIQGFVQKNTVLQANAALHAAALLLLASASATVFGS
jgi:hypothetical protein